MVILETVIDREFFLIRPASGKQLGYHEIYNWLSGSRNITQIFINPDLIVNSYFSNIWY